MRWFSLATAVGLAVVSISSDALAGKDLDAVKARGKLICGVATGSAAIHRAAVRRSRHDFQQHDVDAQS
jgi:general L-amino acid transport system substrate-binding protein